MVSDDGTPAYFMAEVQAFSRLGIAKPSSRVMKYLFASSSDLDSKMEKFGARLRTLAKQASKTAGDIPASHQELVMPGALVFTSPSKAIVIVHNIESHGAALMNLGRPQYQHQVQPG